MGVEFRGSVAARNNAHFSTTTADHNARDPDLVLRPCKEGVDFTLRLIQANRMAKVVQLQCGPVDDSDDKGEEEEKKASNHKHHQDLTTDDIQNLFHAIGGNAQDDEEDEEDWEEVPVTDEYSPPSTQQYSGLPHLESFSIITGHGEESTPSLIGPLTQFLGASGSFGRFTRLSLHGVNLRGGLLEWRGLAEAFRLHPHVRNVQMVACGFTPEQQATMEVLEQVFVPKRPSSSSSTRDSQRASLRHMKQLVLQHQTEAATAAASTNGTETTAETTKQSSAIEVTTEPDDITNEGNWFQRVLRSCFCWC